MDQRIDRCTTPREYISDNLICAVCADLLDPNSAVIIRPCFHMFCRLCLARTIVVRASIQKCPVCQSTYHRFVQLPSAPDSTGQDCCSVLPIKIGNPPMFRILSKLIVACKNASNGCTWKGSAADDETHFAACVTECPSQVCKKVASELERCKVKCVDLESEVRAYIIRWAEIESRLEACNIKCSEMERELGAYKMKCIDMENELGLCKIERDWVKSELEACKIKYTNMESDLSVSNIKYTETESEWQDLWNTYLGPMTAEAQPFVQSSLCIPPGLDVMQTKLKTKQMEQRIDRCTTPQEYISDNLICAVCTDLLDPNTALIIHTCSHMFCTRCLARTIVGRLHLSTQKCPMCQSIFHVKAPTQPGSTANPEPEKKPNAQLIKTANPPVFRMLSKLTVTCRNASQGCLWKGSLADDEAHFAACKPECQIQVCKKAVAELEACKIKCAEIESELAACKVACTEMEKRAAESAASERKANLSITKKHAEEVARLTSQLEGKDACLEQMQRERIDSAVRERGMADSIDMLTMRLSYLMTREEERSLQFMESMPALFSSDSLTSIVGATAGGYLLAYVRAKGFSDGTAQRSNGIAGNRRVEREIDLDRFPTKSSLLTATHLDFFDQRMESWIAVKMTAWKNNRSQSGIGHLEKDLLPAAVDEISPAAVQELMKLPTLEIIQQSLHLIGTHPSLL
ncbi:hypothetical protein HDU78_011650 [Chytriomyces hyalinus]|nr:hypothetical protein HDU78_011650 [Chytriomyces hyalinus]